LFPAVPECWKIFRQPLQHLHFRRGQNVVSFCYKSHNVSFICLSVLKHDPSRSWQNSIWVHIVQPAEGQIDNIDHVDTRLVSDSSGTCISLLLKLFLHLVLTLQHEDIGRCMLFPFRSKSLFVRPIFWHISISFLSRWLYLRCLWSPAFHSRPAYCTYLVKCGYSFFICERYFAKLVLKWGKTLNIMERENKK
jgi:hypothetical protein